MNTLQETKHKLIDCDESIHQFRWCGIQKDL